MDAKREKVISVLSVGSRKLYGLDLFSGIGGISKALENHVRPIAYCENDRYCQSVLLSNMASGTLPLAPIWDDIRTLEPGSGWPLIEIIYGGFPCQDISISNHRGQGLEGERSGLFKEIMRIVNEVEPPFVFLENVPAISFRGLGEVARSFATRGYDMRWTSLSAYEVGAPHIRKRWWCLAYASKSDGWLEQIYREKCEKEAHAGNNGETEFVADAAMPQLHAARKRQQSEWRPQERSCGRSWWETEPDVGRVVNGLPMRVDRIKALGNSVVPQQAKKAFEYLMGMGE